MTKHPPALPTAYRIGRGPRILIVGTVFLMTVAVLLCTLSYAVYAERAAGDTRRYPMGAPGRTASTTTLLIDFQSTADRLAHSVVYLEPDGPAAPLPPGLEDWLEPGEIAVSPALAAAAGPDGVGLPAGRVVATISREGLSTPDERLAYVGASELAEVPGAHPYASFGAVPPVSPWDVSSSGALFGESMTVASLTTLLAALVLMAVAPAVGAFVIVCSGLRRRQARRDLLLDVLGAPRGWRRAQQRRALMPWVLLGTMLAAAAVTAPVLASARVPLTGFQLEPRLVTSHPLLLVLALGVSLLLALLLASWTPAPRAVGTRLSVILRRARQWWLWAAMAAVGLARWGPDLLDPAGGWVWAITYWAGVLAVLALVPLGITYAVTWAATRAARAAARARQPAALVAARWLAASPDMTLRVALALVLVLGVLFQAVAATQGTSENLRAAIQLERTVDDRIVELTTYDEIAGDDLSRALPGLHAVVTRPDPELQRLSLSGSCEALTVLGVSCDGTPRPPSRARPETTALAGYAGLQAEIVGQATQVTRLPPDSQVWLLRGDLERIDAVQAHRAVEAEVGPRARVRSPGDAWIVGARTEAQQGRWVPLFGLLGLAATMIALGADLHSRSRGNAERVALTAVLTGRPGAVLRLTVLALGLPLVVIGLASFLVQALVIVPVVTTVPPTPPPALLLAGPVMTLLLITTAVLVVVGSWSARRRSRTWVARG